METGVSMGLGMRRVENIKIEYSRGRCIKVVNIRLKIHSTFFLILPTTGRLMFSVVVFLVEKPFIFTFGDESAF